MKIDLQDAERWLDREDQTCRKDRIDRLAWLASEMPPANYYAFHGGGMTKYLYEEARYSFVYAQFLATIVLGFAFIEHSLVAMFYAAGRNDLERASISKIFDEAVAIGWLSDKERDWLDRARKMRNPVTHFRPPLVKDSIEYRSVNQEEGPYDVLEEDARHVMATVMRLLTRGGCLTG